MQAIVKNVRPSTAPDVARSAMILSIRQRWSGEVPSPGCWDSFVCIVSHFYRNLANYVHKYVTNVIGVVEAALSYIGVVLTDTCLYFMSSTIKDCGFIEPVKPCFFVFQLI